MIELTFENQAAARELAVQEGGPRASLYFPTGQTFEDARKSKTLLKNLLRESAARLQAAGHSSAEIEAALAEGQELLRNQRFWQAATNGMAIFASRQQSYFVRSPLQFDPQAFAEPRFNILPLVPLLSGNGTFYVLAVSKKRLRMIEAGRRQAREIEIEGIPTSLDEVLQYEQKQRHFGLHTSSAPGNGGRSSVIFHGHADSSDEAARKQDLLRFFQIADEGLRAVMRPTQAPLVLAGLEYETALYREANTYAGLIDGCVCGNADRSTPEQLRDQAWSLVEPLFDAPRRQAEDDLRRYSGSELVSLNVNQIISAARHGQVSALFVSPKRHLWGRLDPNDGAEDLHDVYQPGDEDVLNFAAARTLTGSGSVYPLSPNLIPPEAVAAARLRYSAS